MNPEQQARQTVHNIMLEAALRYTDPRRSTVRWKVVVLHGVNPQTKACTCTLGSKCKAPGKHPRLHNWTHAATEDHAVLKRLFTKYPNSNIGLMPPPGHIVIDVDPRNGGDARGLMLTAARTPTQTSGSGGTHYVVKVDDDVVLPNLKKRGIDFIKPGRQQFVVEPSMHVNGGRYFWQAGKGVGTPVCKWKPPVALGGGTRDEPLVDSDAVAPELAPLVPVQEALDAPVDMVKDWLQAVPSDEYSEWIAVGQALKHAYGDDAFELWDTWSARSDKYPGTEDLQKKWDGFDKNRDRALRTLRSVRHLAQMNGWRYTPPELEFSSNLWRSGLVGDIVSAEPPPIEWVIGEVLPRGKVVMLAGPGGSGKSFLMLVLAIQHGLGAQLLGDSPFSTAAPENARKVMSLTAEEDRDDVHRRLHAVFDAYMVSDAQRVELGSTFSVQCTRGKDWRLIEEVGGQLVASKACDIIIDQLRNELGLSLLMIDPSIMFAGIDENDNKAAAVYMRVLDRIARELNCAVLVGTHTNKGTISMDQPDQSSMRGASAFADNARGVWLLRTMTADEATLHTVNEADRHRYTCLRVLKNNYGPTGAHVWLERTAGGALRLVALPTLGAQAPGTTRTQQRELGVRAAAMQAHTLELLQWLQVNEDEMVGGTPISLRALGVAVWARDPTLTESGTFKRARSVVDYCVASGFVAVRGTSTTGGRTTAAVYAVTDIGKELLT